MKKGCDTCITLKSRSARGASPRVPITMTPTWNGAWRADTESDTCTPGWALSLLHSRDTWGEQIHNQHVRENRAPITVISHITLKLKYIVVLVVDGHVRRVTGDLSVREDAVDGDTDLGGPGRCRRHRERGGSLCPSGYHLTSGAHLEGEQRKGSDSHLHLTTNLLIYFI